MQELCKNKCGKIATIKTEPPRSATSPNSYNFYAKSEKEKRYNWYCSEECKKEDHLLITAWWADLDRNASDSECFEHDHWETDRLHRRIRVGRCKITGDEVRVEPMQPGDNSGQPRACYDHFVLRDMYKKALLGV